MATIALLPVQLARRSGFPIANNIRLEEDNQRGNLWHMFRKPMLALGCLSPKSTIRHWLAAALVFALHFPTAHAQIFVANAGSNTIGSYSTSGAVINASLISGLSGPLAVAVSGSDLFVASNNGVIGHYTTSGAIINASLITGLDSPFGLAVSGADLFVTNFWAGTIGRYSTGGALLDASLISGLGSPSGIAVSGSDLFVIEQDGRVGKYSTSGAVINASLITADLV